MCVLMIYESFNQTMRSRTGKRTKGIRNQAPPGGIPITDFSQLEHSVKPSQLLFQGYNTFLQLTNNDDRCDHIRRPTVFSLMTTKFKYRYYDLKHCKQTLKRYN